MRGIIDYQSQELRTIETCVAADQQEDLVEELVDYLNCFESFRASGKQSN